MAMDYDAAGRSDAGTARGTFVPELAGTAATAAVTARSGAIQLVPGPGNVVVLPDGATLDDITVRGRDLVIELEDGRIYVIADGAVFVPEIVVEGVAIPPLNFAALLTGLEPEPAAGAVRSSGGNFAEAVGPIQAAFDLGNLLPYTELAFPKQPQREIITARLDNTPAIVIITPDQPAGAVSAIASVNEAGLPARGPEPAGSNPGPDSETTIGTIAVQSLDGFGGLTINGIAITAIGQTITTAHGVLTITSIAPGSYGYSYRLTDNTLAPTSADEFTVIVTDSDGDTATATLTINIIDDAPAARDDAGNQAAENAPVTINVMTNDTPGADGVRLIGGVALVAGSLTGTGSVAYNNEGTFTYTPGPGEAGAVSFRYTITDGDGDPATATVTLNLIKDSVPGIDFSGTAQVAEAGLPPRGDEPAGSDFSANSETASGTIITSTGGDALVSLLINGINVTNGGTVSGASGTLVVTAAAGVYSYSYTLSDNASGNANSDSFTVVVTDSDGDAASNLLVIAIADDAPAAAADSDALGAGQYGPATGNVITDTEADGGLDTVGADGAAVTAITGAAAGTVGGTTAGTYGVLTLNADGGYSYVRNPGTPGNVSDVFTYTITDADGDASAATLTITIADAAPVVAENLTALLDDDALAGGNPLGSGDDADGQNLTGTLSGSGGDGALTFALLASGAPAGFSYDSVTAPGSLLVVQGTTTVLTITLNSATGAYTVTQNAPILHAAGAEENNQSFTLDYTVTDIDGSSAPGTLSINVDDDTPLATGDTGTTTESVKDINAAFVLDFSPSIDDAQLDVMLTQVKLAITQLDAGTGGAVAIRFVVFASTSVASGPFASAVDANAYLDTLNPVSGGARPAGIGLSTDFTDAINLTLKTFTADPTAINQVFFLSDGHPHQQTGTGGNSLADATAAAWNSFVDTNDVSVWAIGIGKGITLPRLQDVDLNDAPDNVPIMLADFGSLSAALAALVVPTPISGNVDLGDSFGADGGRILAIEVGATAYRWDGANAIALSSGGTIAGTSISVATPLGATLAFNFATGAWSYAAPTSVAVTSVETFNYTIVDGDGDTSTAPLAITVLNEIGPATTSVAAAVDDDGLAGGLAGGTGDLDANLGEVPASSSEAVYNGTLGISFGPDGAGTTTFAQMQGQTVAIGIETAKLSWDGSTNTLTATGPRGALFAVVLTDPATGAYTVTLLDNVRHASVAGENDAAVTLTYKVSDGNGTTGTGTLNITFDDDTPALGAVQSQQASNDPLQAPVVGALNFSAGADGAGTAMNITASTAGITAGGKAIFTQQVGNVLTGYADTNGSGGVDAGDAAVFSITVNPAAGASGQYVFDLLGALDPAVASVAINSGSAFGAGPGDSIIVTDPVTAQALVMVTGWSPTGGFTAGEEAAWLSGGTPALTAVAGVNGSINGWGLFNNNFDAGEFLRFDFGAIDDFDGPGGYTPPVSGPMAQSSAATFSCFKFGAGDVVEFVAHYTDGTTQSFTRRGGVDANSFTITAPTGAQIAWVDTYQSSGDIKLNITRTIATANEVDETIAATVQLRDGDGDRTAVTAFAIHVADRFADEAGPETSQAAARFSVAAEPDLSAGQPTGVADGPTAASGTADLPDFAAISSPAMDALLGLQAPVIGKTAEIAPQDLPAIREAFADTAGSQAVDTIVDHFAPESGGRSETVQGADSPAMAGLLNHSISIASQSVPSPLEMVFMLDHQDTAAMA